MEEKDRRGIFGLEGLGTRGYEAYEDISKQAECIRKAATDGGYGAQIVLEVPRRRRDSDDFEI